MVSVSMKRFVKCARVLRMSILTGKRDYTLVPSASSLGRGGGGVKRSSTLCSSSGVKGMPLTRFKAMM